MKLRQICMTCEGRYGCAPAGEDNWKSCRGKSYRKDKVTNSTEEDIAHTIQKIQDLILQQNNKMQKMIDTVTKADYIPNEIKLRLLYELLAIVMKVK